MHVERITYKGFDDIERTEDFYFNITESELMKMQLGTDGGYAEMLKRIVDAKKGPELLKVFEEIIMVAYGEKSDDGRSFIKLDRDGRRLANNFIQTAAYDKLFMDLFTDSKKAADFMRAIMSVKIDDSEFNKIVAQAEQ